MNNFKFFGYDPETGFETFKTKEEAINYAQEAIDWYREGAGDGWDECVTSVCWGEIKGETVEVGLRPATEDAETSCEMYCDYILKEVEHV